MAEQEFVVKMELTLLPNGAILKINHPDRGSNPGGEIQRVFTSRAALVAVIDELFEQYVLYPEK